MWMVLRRVSLTQWIFVALVAGFLLGAFAPEYARHVTPFRTLFLHGIKSVIAPLWMMEFDRKALFGSFGALRGSLSAGFLGAAASECWFIGFSLTSAANVRTLALVEVIFAQAIGTYWLGQKVTKRQLAGMAVIWIAVA